MKRLIASDVAVEDPVGANADLVKAGGYVHAIGLSEVGPDTIRRVQKACSGLQAAHYGVDVAMLDRFAAHKQRVRHCSIESSLDKGARLERP